ncbi:MAG: dehypoxanthine futalosine cyclase [bacterium]|nr:dehypoxanthine futalosine cyclase [bacterium]
MSTPGSDTGPSASVSPHAHDTGVTPKSRVSDSEALEMYRESTIHELGRRAFETSRALHPEPYRTYVVDRNINYSNLCTAKCAFCNYKVAPGDSNGYVLSLDEIGRKLDELLAIGGSQVLMQGGLVPAETLGFEWYLDLLRYIKTNYPSIHIHAFSPPEVFAFHQMFDMTVGDVLLRLQDAGLDTIPGGGAEILVDRVRNKISRGKTRTDEYLLVMREAHRIGMRTSITMMFGHLETIPERIEHFRRIRDLQDETGGFTAFILWTFQPENTPLGRVRRRPPDERSLPDGKHLHLAGAAEYLRMLSLARLYLDNVANIQSSWVTQGPKIGQLALFFGANDMGSVMMEENVVSAAGTTFCLDEAEIRRLITDAGWQPRRRNCYYELTDQEGRPTTSV